MNSESDKYRMSDKRFNQVWLQNSEMTEEEQKYYHFCWDWDGLLIHKDDPEFKSCTCIGGNVIKNLHKGDPDAP